MTSFFKKLFGGLGSLSARRTPDDPKRYKVLKRIGQGTFGSVWEAKDRVTKEIVAIKKVRIADDGNAEHELQYNLAVSHKNVIRLIGHFREKRKRKEENGKADDEEKELDPNAMNMCLVLEYSRTSLKDIIDDFKKCGKVLPTEIVMVLTFQMYRGLHYLHVLRIIHRDIKPSNLLIDKKSFVLRISDLGHAVQLVPGEPRDTRACSVPYRAPELELHNEDYNEKIDIWSSGCVVSEAYTGEILFREFKNVQHYDRIRELLGDPTPEDLAELQPLLKNPPAARYPSVFDQRFIRYKSILPEAAVALIKKCLAYRPSRRPSAMELMADPYYDALRNSSTFDMLLYDFIEEELANTAPDVLERVAPARCRNEVVLKKLAERGQEKTLNMSAKTAHEPTASTKSAQDPTSSGKTVHESTLSSKTEQSTKGPSRSGQTSQQQPKPEEKKGS